MKSIRAGMGLGDALYLQGVARYFKERGQALEVCCAWPDVFRYYGDMAKVTGFRRNRIDILAHYSLRKSRTDTNQWQDCCIQAGIREPWDMRLDWKVTNQGLVDSLKGKPVLCVGLPRSPMGRTDGFGKELLPDCAAIQRCIDVLRQKYLIVQVGGGKALHQFTGIDVDLSNRTSVCELIDVASQADAFLGYVSFLVPLAESFDKPALFVWSRRGTTRAHRYITQITPQKILSKPTSRFIFDNAPAKDIDAAASALL